MKACRTCGDLTDSPDGFCSILCAGTLGLRRPAFQDARPRCVSCGALKAGWTVECTVCVVRERNKIEREQAQKDAAFRTLVFVIAERLAGPWSPLNFGTRTEVRELLKIAKGE